MKARVIGSGLLISERRLASLMSQLPKVGAAFVKLEVLEDGASKEVMLPVARRSFKAYRLGDGTVLLVPQGPFQLIWAVALRGRSISASDLSRLGKQVRELEIAGVYGSGVSMPGLVFRQGPRPSDFRRGPVRKFLRAAERIGSLGNVYVAEVGIPVHMLDRLGSRVGLRGEKLAAAAAVGDVLLVLRRMPLTDPVTGFVIVKPVPVDSPGEGDVLYISPDISLVLYGDQDGDKYYVDLVAVSRSMRGEYEPVPVVRPTAGTGFSVPHFMPDIESHVKMSGLRGAPALAGVLAARGVGALFAVAHRIAASVKLAGYPCESLEILSCLLRILEPLFDARKRAVVASVKGEYEGEPVMGYTLPYIKAIVRSLRADSLHAVAGILEELASSLRADSDEDARAVGEVVARACDVMRGLPDISLSSSSYEELSDVDVFAFGSCQILVDGKLVVPSARPRRDEVTNDREAGIGSVTADLELPEWCRLTSRELRHQVGGSFEVELPVVFGENGELHPRVRNSLAGVYQDILVAFLPHWEQVAPKNERDRSRFFEEGGFVFVSRPERLNEAHADFSDSGLEAPEANGLVEQIGDSTILLSPVWLEEGEKVSVYRSPIKDDGEVISVELREKMSAGEVLSSHRLFHIGLGSVEKEGRTWYRFHLLALVAEKLAGETYTGKRFSSYRYRLASLYATPWFDIEPDALVSGMRVMNSFADRPEFLTGRVDTVALGYDSGVIRVGNRFVTPQAALVLALLSGVFWRALTVSGGSGALFDVLKGAPSHPIGAELMVRIQRDVRAFVRRLVSQAVELRTPYAEPTARHIIVFGDLVRDGMVWSGSDPDPDYALHRFDRLVRSVMFRLYGKEMNWYPRKGGQNRLIIVDTTDPIHWADMLAFGAQEWYRFVRETPGLKAVPSMINGKEGIIQELLVAFVDAPGTVQPVNGKDSSETAYLAASSVDWVEKEVSQLVHMPTGEISFSLLKPRLEELSAHGFTHLRSSDGGLIQIDSVLKGENLDGVAHRVYEHSVTSNHVEKSVQFWAVSRSRPAGAKIVLLDGMVKSFAGVVDGELSTPAGKVDAVFSAISLRKKQAWGLVLNGLARVQDKPELIDRMWFEYRSALASGKSEQDAMLAAFGVAREAGLTFQAVPIFSEGKKVGEGLVVKVKAVFVDDVSVRDDEPDEAGMNGTVLFAADLAGVPYQRRFVNMRDALALSQALFGLWGMIDLPIIDPQPDDSTPPPSGGGISEVELPEEVEEVEATEGEMDIVDLGSLGSLLGQDQEDPDSGDDLEELSLELSRLSSGDEEGELGPVVSIGELGSLISQEQESDGSDGSEGSDDPDDPDDPEDSDDDDPDDPDDPEDVDLILPEDELTPDEDYALSFFGEWVDSLRGPVTLVIGTRHPDDRQSAAVREVVADLVRAGSVVMSGGADGIDTIAVRTALEMGGNTLTVLPWDRPYPYGETVVQVLKGEYADDKRSRVMENHPAPGRLTEGVVKLHMRNVELVDRLLAVRAHRKLLDLVRRECVVFAVPSWYGDEPSGGTAMGIRLAKLYGIPCKVYHPQRGWFWYVPREESD